MTDPLLTEIQIATYKDTAIGDPTPVPTAATVEFYRAGATVSTATTVPGSVLEFTIDVHDSSQLAVGDQLIAGPDGAALEVDGIPSATSITVTNNGAAVPLAAGSRLMVTNERPRLYSTRGGPLIAGSLLTTDAVNGRATAYLATDRFDYTTQVAGQSKRLYVDAPGGRFASDVVRNDVRDFPSIQAAIDALPASGGVVYIPFGTYTLTQGLVIFKDSVTLQGDGYGTVIRPQTPNQFDLLTVRASHCKISDLMLDGRASGSTGTKSCLVIQGPAVPSGNINLCHLENLSLTTAPLHGLWLKDALLTLIVNCEIVFNLGAGVRLSKSTIGVNGSRFLNCVFTGNGGSGVIANDAVGLTFLGCAFEGNKGGTGETDGNALQAKNCLRIEAYSCYIESAATGSTRSEQFILFEDCGGAIVDSCWFQGGEDGGGVLRPKRAVRFTNSPCSRLTSNTFQHLETDFALFSTFSNDSVEFGNRDTGTSDGIPKFTMEQSVRVLGLSRAALGLPTHASDATRPTSVNVRAASLIGHTAPSPGATHLQLWDGAAWDSVPLLVAAVNIVNQTAPISGAVLSTAPRAAVYAVEVCALCTTIGAAVGSPDISVIIGWQDDVGAVTETVLTLPTTVTGRVGARALIRVAGGNVTYTTVIDVGVGTPVYALYIRMVSLG